MRNRNNSSLEAEILNHFKSLDPNQRHVINVSARYGEYQIIVEPNASSQSVKVSGHIHHMYLTPANVSAYPTAEEVQNNLQHTVIARDISIDVELPNKSNAEVKTAEYINLAGDEGSKIMQRTQKSLPQKAEEIMEDDIIRALDGGEESFTF